MQDFVLTGLGTEARTPSTKWTATRKFLYIPILKCFSSEFEWICVKVRQYSTTETELNT